jgi:hypothetical protein
VELGTSYANALAQGYRGGGSVRIKTATSGSITINGSIRSNGAGCASGGSIWLDTQTLRGDGTIQASGGDDCNYGAGGGGRIAIYYANRLNGFASNSTVNTKIYSRGGTSGGLSRAAAAGTIYMKNTSQTYGDLLVDNNGITTDSIATTRIPQPTPSALTGVEATLLNALTGFSYGSCNIPTQYSNFYINPNVNQNITKVVYDDDLFLVSSNTSSALNLSDDPSSIASVGDNYRMVLIFDNLEVRGRAKLDFGNNDILVNSGDITSDNSSDFRLRGYIKANAVDIGSGTWTTVSADGGDTTGITFRCAGSGGASCP